MKVIESEENYVKFDNGLELLGYGDNDCCAYNYLDFEQLPVGTELKTLTARGFLRAAKVKDDGFIIKDIEGAPKWVQARSSQNGYYSNLTDFYLKYKGEEIQGGQLAGDIE